MINKHRISFSHVHLYAYFLNWRNSTETSHLRETKPTLKRRLSAKYLPLKVCYILFLFSGVTLGLSWPGRGGDSEVQAREMECAGGNVCYTV